MVTPLVLFLLSSPGTKSELYDISLLAKATDCFAVCCHDNTIKRCNIMINEHSGFSISGTVTDILDANMIH